MHSIDPFHYLRDVFRRLPTQPTNALAELTPKRGLRLRPKPATRSAPPDGRRQLLRVAAPEWARRLPAHMLEDVGARLDPPYLDPGPDKHAWAEGASRSSRPGVYFAERLPIFDVPHDQVGREIHRAGVDLDRLERLRGPWRDPAKMLGSPNLAALLYVCYARRNRVSTLAHERRLQKIVRRVEQAYELARSRAWIEAFIGPQREKRQKVESADR